MVFTDASSAILLNRTGLFNTLVKAGTIVFAASVYQEVSRAGHADTADFIHAVENRDVSVRSPANPKVLTSFPDTLSLDRGEKDTLWLFLETRKGFILTDDGKAARLCDRHQLPFINALLVPRILYYAGIVDLKTHEKHTGLIQKAGRYSSRILSRADRLTPEDLLAFIQGIHS